MKFNINSYVRVKLTDLGREEIRRHNSELTATISERTGKFTRFSMPEEDADGWSKWQAWELMQRFGHMLYLGGKMPFDAEIEIVE
jgi:DNA-binding MarR family transcriptional regulator